MSVVIPALNEEPVLGATLRAVASGATGLVEVIVADGGSVDRTVEVAEESGARVVTATAGRARQMNRGAEAATGELLFFVHADSVPPPGYDRRVRELLSEAGTVAGAFRLAIAAEGGTLRLIERVANLRSRFLQMPYGDQGLFLRREVFEKEGGFPDLPLMEDFELVRRLRRRGRVVLAPEAVVTSARRWLELGPWRCTLHNWATVIRYLSGTPAESLARAYRRAPGSSARSS